MHNTRATEQWQIISQHIDFKGKTVVDLGCGYGDILTKCADSGAICTGIEKDESIFLDILIPLVANNALIGIHYRDIDKWIIESDYNFDVSICFSVLPYLNRGTKAMGWMKDHSKISLIECQYAGDGPGPSIVKNDDDMRDWLSIVGWRSIEPIGKTLVEDRQKYRTIWMCQ